MNLKPFFKGIWSFCAKNSTKLLAAGAIISEAFGFYMMHKEAPIVHERLKELPPDANWKDKAKVAAPIYIPAAALFLLSSTCVVGGCVSGEKKIAMLTSLYSASQAAIQKCEDELVARVGPEGAKQVKAGMVKDFLTDGDENEARKKDNSYDPFDDNNVYHTGKGNQKFREPFTGKIFTSSLDAVKSDIADFERIIISEDWGSVNEFFDCIGIPRISKIANYAGYNSAKLYESKSKKGLDVTFPSFTCPNGYETAFDIVIHNDIYLYNGNKLYD